MIALLGDATGKELSVIKDPFTTEGISEIWIHYRTTLFSKAPTWGGWVEFTNGRTKGKQNLPEVSSFEELIAAVRQVLASVK